MYNFKQNTYVPDSMVLVKRTASFLAKSAIGYWVVQNGSEKYSMSVLALLETDLGIEADPQTKIFSHQCGVILNLWVGSSFLNPL